MTAIKVLLIGSTGYVGGTILAELFTRPQLLFHSGKNSQNLEIVVTCVTRSSENAGQLKAAYPTTVVAVGPSIKVSVSIETAIGSLDSTDFLTKLASETDVVIQCADCDHEAGIRALLDGVEKAPRSDNRPTPGGKAVMIHVSGAGNVVDPTIAYGDLNPVVISDDLASDRPPLRLPKIRMHAALEQALAADADKREAQLVILSPATILGQGAGRVGKTETYPAMWYKAVLELGQVFIAGKGQNLWSSSSVKDVAGAIIWTLGEAIQPQDQQQRLRCRLGWGTKGYYYVESFEVSGMQRAAELAKRLAREGKVKSLEPISMTTEDIRSRFGPWMPLIVGTNMRCRADRLRAFGWRPSDMDWRAMAAEGTGERV